MRISAEAAAELIFDELIAAVKLDWQELSKRTGLTRGQVYSGIRWLRDTLGDNALITHADHTYALALSADEVKAYRQRRLYFYITSLLRLKKVIAAGSRKFEYDTDIALSVQLIGTAISLLKREAGGDGADRTLERVS